MNVSSYCSSLFIDINDTLYCSIHNQHKVVKRWLGDNGTSSITAAGNSSAGPGLNQLRNPRGIFVDADFNLYVADFGNDRIQKFTLETINGTIVAGNITSSPTIPLNGPSCVLLDENKYLFIVDSNNHRIIRSSQNGFHCIIGCNGSSLSLSQLQDPRRMAFDIYGNIYVTDTGNSRVQKFLLSTNSCDTYTTQLAVFTSSLKETTLLSNATSIFYNTQSTTQISSTMILSTNQLPTSQSFSTPIMTSPSCGPYIIGLACNISATPCQMMRPCQNNGTCFDDNSSISNGYTCLCPQGFNGSTCEYDYRPCRSNTCWNNGQCNETSNTTFECLCQSHWTGVNCERKKNYCENVTCLNRGVCQPLLGGYKCGCLSGSYSGKHCEIVSRSKFIHEMVSQSIGYTSYIMLGSVCLFVIMMDVLKYCFGVDLTRNELERIRKRKRLERMKKRRCPPEIQRFTYIDESP